MTQHAFVFPASFSQQRLWFLDQLEPGHAFYNMPAALRLSTSVDPEKLRLAFDDLVSRHESLRTCFTEVDGYPMQVVLTQAPVPFVDVDLTHISPDNSHAVVEQRMREESTRAFDLSEAPLMRVALLRLAEPGEILLVTLHHIVADGWSFGILFREIALLYEARTSACRAPLLKPPIQYADYALWQHQNVSTRELERQYWRQKLAGFPDVLALPTDRSRPAEQRFRGGLVPIAIGSSTIQGLRRLARSEDATLFMLLLAGFQALLYRYTGADHIAVGSPIAGRHYEGLDGVVGLFVNTLVLGTRFDGNPTVTKLIGRVRETALGAYAHQDFPFEQLVAELAPRRTLGHQPLFQVLFGLQSVSENGDSTPAPFGLTALERRVSIDTGTAKCDLTLSLTEAGDTVSGFLEYDTDLFDTVTIERFRGHLQTLLSGMIAAPHARVSELPLMTDPERNRLINEWNQTSKTFPDNTPIHKSFEARAAADPNAPAIVDGEREMTYGEVDSYANRLARELILRGVRRGDRVGICLPRSAALMIAWIATVKAGAAYVPLDPEYPQERLSFMVTDASVRIVVADMHTLAVFEFSKVETIDVEAYHQDTEIGNVTLPDEVGGDDLAYVVYTSGSTGVPKGVAVPHRAINRLILNTNYIEFEPSDCIAQISSASFDAATFEIWGSLVNGLRSVIVPRDIVLEPQSLVEHLRHERVTILFLTTALFNQIVADMPSAFQFLRYLLVGGEMANPERFREVLSHGPPEHLLHVYGPTETTTFATFHQVKDVPEDATTIPIGKPIAHTRTYVVDSRMNLVPVGLPGELVIAGEGVAMGYLDRPALTAEKFNPDSWSKEGGRVYRTGDLVRYRGDGVLEILGRIDDQVKIRGFRVEPGEVETLLARHPDVRAVSVLARDIGAEKRLVAYVVIGNDLPESELRRWLQEQVPEYMIPTAIIRLERIPLTANGKVDWMKLPAPQPRGGADKPAAPRTREERTLTEIWAEVLGLEVVGVHDNFFELGGDSILSIQMISRANRAGLRFTPKQLFKHQTIAALAPLSNRHVTNEAEQGPVSGEVPLTPIQHWFFEQQVTDPHYFNQAIMIDQPVKADLETLERAVQSLMLHHDALRLRFKQTASGWRQWIAPPSQSNIVSGYNVTEFEADTRIEAVKRIATELQGSLDLENGPILRVARFVLEPSRVPCLLILSHHLAVDVVSWRIIVEDLQTVLWQISEGKPVELPAKTTSFKAWSEQMHLVARAPEMHDELQHWLAFKPDPDAGLLLPTDFAFKASANTVASASVLTVSLDLHETEALFAGAREFGAQMPEILIAGLVTALRKWVGDRTLAIDVEWHGRDVMEESDIDVSRTVGWFTTIAPLHLRLPGEAEIAGAIAAVKAALKELPRHGIGYQLLRYFSSDPAVRNHLAAFDTAQIAFNYLGQFAGRETADPSATPLSEPDASGPTRSGRGQRRHLFEIDAGILSGRLLIHWTYSAALHSRDTVERIAADTAGALRTLVKADANAKAHHRVAASGMQPSGIDERDLEIIQRYCPDLTDAYPLSPLQEGMLFHSLYAPRSGQYVVQMSLRLAATLDVDRFREAWQTVVGRHAILRSAFFWDGIRRPMQVVSADVQLPWDVQDWRTLPSEYFEAQFDSYLARGRSSGFDPGGAPLMRFALVRTSDAGWSFVWTCHHLLIDGWSRPLVLEEVADTYEALGRGAPFVAPARRPYRDYIEWLANQSAPEAEHFWRETLAGFNTRTPMLAALPQALGQPTDVNEFGTEQRLLSRDLTDRLQAAGRRAHVTLSTLVHGAWALLLARYCGADDVVFGATVSGRPAALDGVEHIIGPFINTLPVRVAIPAARLTGDWLSDLQTQLVSAREFEYSPLVDVQRWSGVAPGTPLFESLLVFENYPAGASARRDASDAQFIEWTNYPLTVAAIPGSRLKLEISYTRRVTPDAIGRLLDHFEHLLFEISDGLNWPVGALSLLSAEESRRLIVEWNRTSTAPREGALAQLISRQTVLTPDAIAHIWGRELLTYAELRERACSVARRLRRAGVAPGMPVGVLLPRSPHLPVILLAILEVGGPYVLLDPMSPDEWIAFIARDAGLRIVVTDSSARRPEVDLPFLVIDESDQHGDKTLVGEMLCAGPEDPAYVVYTSGTTGKPKGVAVSHRSLSNHALGMAERYRLQSSDRVLQLASVSFDVLAEEIFPTLVSGGAIVPWRQTVAPSIAEFVRFVDEQRITIVNLPTPLWHEWVDEIDRGFSTVPPSVRSVIVGTDRVAPERLARWRALVGDRVLWSNAYGCAEATVTSTVFSLSNGDHDTAVLNTVPIGRPVANTRLYVVDHRMALVPVGVPGELVIAGDGVAIGYLNQPELTASKFIPEQWRPGGGRAYRTGDLVRYRPDGLLELLGRLDDQVKIRGIRVEPGELEKLLGRHPAVRDAVVVARDRGREQKPEKQLVAYVVVEDDTSMATLRTWLAERVPEYLVPAAIVRMERFPKSVTGKVDRAALPAPNLRGGRKSSAPRTALEEILTEIWAEILDVEEIGIDDNFFELGGHSLIAMRLVSRIRQAIGAELPLGAIFEAPTIAALAERLDCLTAQTVTSTISRRRGNGPCPLSFAQERLWFLDQLAPGTSLYNMPCSLRIEGHLNLGAIEASLNEIVRRHESLRTTFAMIDERPVQVISPTGRIGLRFIDLSEVPATERQIETIRCTKAELRRPFDLERGPLVRASILRMHDTEHVLLVTMHHIISDGWSMGVLLRELETLYNLFSRGRPSSLPELAIQYGDYAAWQREWLDQEILRKQVAYWRERLAGMPLALDIPTDRPRPPRQTFRGAYDTVLLPAKQTAALRKLGEREGVTLFMVVLAALQLLLSRLSGQEDIVVGTPIAGRNHVETEPLIGFFLNNLVLRTDLSGDPTFSVLLGRVRDVALGAFAHQDLPFEKLLAELDPPRDLSRTPLFQVFLNVLNAEDERLNLADVVAESFTLDDSRPASVGRSVSDAITLNHADTPVPEAEVWSQFDMTLYVGQRDDALQFVLVYNVDLFSASRMAEFLDQLATLLAQVVENPGHQISSFSLVTPTARLVVPDPSALLDDTWMGSVHDLFSAQARNTPERLAVRDPSEHWTYAELDKHSSQLAHRLLREGVATGDTVAIYAARSATLVWAVLGVLKAGAVFTILDPAYPVARLASYVEFARPRLLLHIEAAGQIPPLLFSAATRNDGPFNCLSLPSLAKARQERFLADEETAAPATAINANSAACLGFTSGSTGRPKGIVGCHGSLTHFMPWLEKTFELNCDDRFSMLSGLSHDPLQREIFTPLCLGATICVPSIEDYDTGARLAAWTARQGITVAHLTPALGQLMTQDSDGEPPRLDSLRLAFFVGDILTRRDIDRLAAMAPNVNCVNFYGSTETQRAVGYFIPSRTNGTSDPQAETIIPAGCGIDDVQLLVLTASGQVCGIGELGEINVRSPHLARGYLNLPKLTAERFLQNPFSANPGDRFYRSGDLGRYLLDGNVAFAGRVDMQVKVRGFRIELSEVEAVIARHENVREVVAMAREDSPGDRRLVAYVVPGNRELTPALLQAFVRRQLPFYMVPAHVVVLRALPVTPNGKVDRQALPPPERIVHDGVAGMMLPCTAVERHVAEIWQDILHVYSPDLRQTFFEAGGHSLLSTQLIARVRKRFGVEIALSRFFRNPTIAGLAAAIEQAYLDNVAARPVIKAASRGDYRVRLSSDGKPIVPIDLKTRLLSIMRGTNGR